MAFEGLSDRLEACVKAYRLPVDTEAPMSQLIPFCSKDKKRETDSISYIVCEKIGKAEIRKTSVSDFGRLMEEV